MRRQRILVTLAALLVGLVVLQQPASADCSGPTLTYETGEFAPGDLVGVTGSSFGNNCYDTGPPPLGQGVLGIPVSNIDILLVQGDTEWVVAMGNADDDYAFEVDVQIPLDAAAGEAHITARWNIDWEPYIPTTDAIVITEDIAAADAIETPIFGVEAPVVEETEVIESTTTTSTTTTTTTTTTSVPSIESPAPAPDDDDTARATWIAVGLVVAAAAIGGLLVLSKR